MKSFNKMKLGLLALLVSCGVTTLADDSWSWNGYMRAGMGYNTDLQSVSKEDVSHLGRYGNEYDTYFGSTLTKKWENDRGEWAKYVLEFNLWDGDLDRMENIQTDRNYVQMGGAEFMPEGSLLWMGTNKEDPGIDLLDTPWKNVIGTGFGYKSPAFDLNFMTNDGIQYGDDTNTYNTVDAIARFGKFEAEVILTKQQQLEEDEKPANMAETSMTTTLSYLDNNYFGLAGTNTIRVQFGSGVKSNQLGSVFVSEEDEDSSYRFIHEGRIDVNDTWKVMPVAVLEGTDAESYEEAETNLTYGARAHQVISNNIGMLYEGIFNTVENEGGNDDADGSSYKLAFGPTYQIDSGYWTRPVMRAALTFIGGDEEVINLNGEDSEVRASYQFEVWF